MAKKVRDIIIGAGTNGYVNMFVPVIINYNYGLKKEDSVTYSLDPPTARFLGKQLLMNADLLEKEVEEEIIPVDAYEEWLTTLINEKEEKLLAIVLQKWRLSDWEYETCSELNRDLYNLKMVQEKYKYFSSLLDT